jgi:hypothetical protein
MPGYYRRILSPVSCFDVQGCYVFSSYTFFPLVMSYFHQRMDEVCYQTGGEHQILARQPIEVLTVATALKVAGPVIVRSVRRLVTGSFSTPVLPSN